MIRKKIFLISLILLLAGWQNIYSGKSVTVKNAAGLKQAINNANFGDEIILANGIWKDVQIDFKGHGVKDNPIILRAETAGQVFVEGKSFIRFGGEYLVVDGLFFRNGYTPVNAVIQFQIDKENLANNCTIRNCVIEDFNQLQRDKPDHWIEFWGRHNTLERCYIAGKSNQGPTVRVDIKGNENIKNYHRIVDNHFGPRPRKGGPRGETIQIGDSQTSMSPCNMIVANNFFERCNGEVEVISNKTNFNEYRNNIFYKCEGSLVMRHGNYCVIDGNYFIGDESSNNIGGIRIINTGHWVTNNYFYNLKGENFRSPLAVMNGIPKSPLNRYNQVTDVVVAHNTWINCKSPLQFGVGSNVSQKDVLPKSEIRSARPIRTLVANNLIYNEVGDKQPIIAHDKLEGIKFKKNVIENKEAAFEAVDGLETKAIEMSEAIENVFIPTKGLDDIDVYKGFEFEKIEIDILGNSRTDKNLAGAICKDNENLTKVFDKKNYGPGWYPLDAKPVTPQILKVTSKAGDLAAKIAQSEDGDEIVLAAGTYEIESSIIINKVITVKTEAENAKAIIKYSGNEKTPLFEMHPKGDIKLTNIVLAGQNTQYAFACLKENMSSHYNVKVSDCEISNFNYVLKAYKESFSDDIIFLNSIIKECQNGLELSEETNDKGDYNVEFLTVDNCQFENVNSNVIDYYRGGYDESTIGGNLLVTNSSFTNCGSKEENGILLNTRGIINVNISKNRFKNNPVKLVALLWGAKNNTHSGNEIINSGKIVVEENLKLKLMY
ncbi:MAG: hypothetical protein JEY94_07805 [Melioribacteraceae bacterium]|nr:hypothetical protein [Melioribacteraceae bacterium]